MSFSAEEKASVIGKYKQHGSDSGSVEVQVALISARLDYLKNHFESHKKDYHSRRGLMQLVGKRRRLLDYLKRRDLDRYRKLIADLGLRK